MKHDRALSNWLFTVCLFIAVLVIFGGYVRLTRSGLSMVEWNVVTGVVPPIGEQAWVETFEKYQRTPEFQKVNAAMSLGEYKTIFYNEYIHRMLGRFTGLLFVVPLAIFLIQGRIPWRESRRFIGIALLFALQGFLGWYMVRSGLIDRPSVSHLRLTVHLLAALALFGLCFWTGLSLRPGDRLGQQSANRGDHDPAHGRGPSRRRSKVHRLALAFTALLVVQIAYGALVAGLKAGHASDTFPLMFGQLIPAGLLTSVAPWWKSLLDFPTTVHFIHRWLAFAVLALAAWLHVAELRQPAGAAVRKAGGMMMGLVVIQIVLGIVTIWLHVPVIVALLHQATALALFATALFIDHRLAMARGPVDLEKAR